MRSLFNKRGFRNTCHVYSRKYLQHKSFLKCMSLIRRLSISLKEKSSLFKKITLFCQVSSDTITFAILCYYFSSLLFEKRCDDVHVQCALFCEKIFCKDISIILIEQARSMSTFRKNKSFTKLFDYMVV